jgi:phosphohistidine phosphatase SixA
METPAVGVRRAYVLLARHAKAGASASRGGSVSEAGQAEVAGVAARLSETIGALSIVKDEDIRIGAVIHGTSVIATETATMLRDALTASGNDVGPLAGLPELDGVHAAPLSPNNQTEQTFAHETVLAQLGEALATGERNAVLVVGHQPAIGIIGQTLTGTTVPIAHGAVACIKGRQRDEDGFADWTLRWAISPSDPVTLEHLRSKIASKMQVAGELGGLVAAGLIFVLTTLPGFAGTLTASVALQYVAAVSLFVSAALNLATVYAYDRLLMPTRFWAEPRRLLAPSQDGTGGIRRTPSWLVWRPPSSDQLVLYQNMIRIWDGLFKPATAFLAVGVAALGLALVGTSDLLLLVAAVAVEAAVGAVLYAYVGRFWPVLGVED